MTTISTIDELLRLVRENEEVRVALRRELLTEELLALPGQFAVMLETQNSMLKDLAGLRRTQDAMLETQASMLETQNSLLETQNLMLRRLDNIEIGYGRMSQDFGNFRGNYAEHAATKSATGIALRLDEAKGLRIDETMVEVLARDRLRFLARGYGTERLAGIPLGVRESFYKADLIMEVAKANGETFYIAVEASYTCDDRDTSRALSHANLLTKFTGKEAWAVIAGVRIDRRIQLLIDGGEVFWYPLEEEEMDVSQHTR